MNHNRTDFEIYTVTFFGHRHIERLNQTMERLESLLRHIIDEHKKVIFENAVDVKRARIYNYI